MQQGERVLRYRLHFYKPNKNYRTQKVKIKSGHLRSCLVLALKQLRMQTIAPKQEDQVKGKQKI